MFIPKFFKVKDFDEIHEFIQQNSFGTIVTNKKDQPIATHIPLEFRKEEDDFYIYGHMAYGNSQWRTFETCEKALIIFQGPHAYISSSWYGHENVPTWNYQAVHVYGKPSILTDEELKDDLMLLLEKYEKHREHAVLWDSLSPELLEREIKGIVGFKVKVEEIQAAYKLSQNRNKDDYQRIIDRLNEENDGNSHRVAEVMKGIRG